MSSRVLFSLGLSIAMLGCPSKEGEQKDAQSAPAGSSSAVTASSAGTTGTGPLASIEASPYLNEAWTTEDGDALPFVYYGQTNVRLSASCRQSTGTLACDAIKALRAGAIEMSSRELDGRTSAGVKACRRLKNKIVVAHNAMGAEDSFCKFPDGSMVANGALEAYALKVHDER